MPTPPYVCEFALDCKTLTGAERRVKLLVSYEAASFRVPTLMPAVTATSSVLAPLAYAGALQMTAVSDNHQDASQAVACRRDLIDIEASPKFAPTTDRLVPPETATFALMMLRGAGKS
jgi:hypothetical protein